MWQVACEWEVTLVSGWVFGRHGKNYNWFTIFFFFHVIWHDSWNTDFLLPQAQRYITQLKSQINSLEAELEEQRAQKQRALVENEQLRMELEAMRRSYADHDMLQNTFLEAESKIFIQH